MSWRDRPYSQPERYDGYGGGHGGGGLGLAMPKPGPMVKWLLIINIGVFLLQLLTGNLMEVLFAAAGDVWWQVWRYVTFQFLHSVSRPMHIVFNMLGLYFLGTPLEQRMGGRRFLTFYLLCGAMAGVSYVLIGLLVGGEQWVPLVGASGGVFGIVLAAAVYFPHFRIIFMFFPVPIRLAAIILFSIMLLTVLQGLGAGQFRTDTFWSHAAHLGGAVTAAVWVLHERHRGPPRARAGGGGPSFGERIRQGQWERKMRRRRKIQQEIDGILEKIHAHGIASLSPREKRLLKQATEMQREEEERIKRL